MTEGPSAGSAVTTIEVDTIDNILDGRLPTAMKIDVEGWEYPVLQGYRATLTNQTLLACVIEVNNAFLTHGHTVQEVFEIMETQGFQPYTYLPNTREVVEGFDSDTGNTLFIRDVLNVKRRLVGAPRRRFFGK